MTRNQEQKGSLHAVIIIVLVIALIGALGWIFWQNFIKKDEAPSRSPKETSTQAAEEKEKVALLNGSIDPDFDTTLTFEYPKSWKYEASISGEKAEQMWSQIINLTSPSGKYVVTYNLNEGGGFGGYCDESDSSNGTIAKLQYDELKDFPGTSYAEYTISGGAKPEGTPDSYASLITTEAARGIKAGDTACKVAMPGVQELGELSYLMGAHITIHGATTSEEFEKALSGPEYEQAKAILLSTKH